jgi:hypothetical protein
LAYVRVGDYPDETNYETLKQEISFQIGMNLKAPSGIVWVVLCLVLALVVFMTLAVAGIVAQRAFAILCLVAMIIAGVASYRVFKNVCRPRKDPG